MKPDSSEIGATRKQDNLGGWSAAATCRRDEHRVQDSKEAATLCAGRGIDTAAPRPVAELLACPAAVASVLTASAQTLSFDYGEVIFRQSAPCVGLYLVVQGQLQRRTERSDARITLGSVRAGDLVELAAALADHRHTYSLVAQSAGSLLLLPLDALQKAFEAYPPLRMQLLEELAREVSRAYHAGWTARALRSRRVRTDA